MRSRRRKAAREQRRSVYHGSIERATLKELTRAYRNLVEDTTRVMLRLKALFRARAIPTRGTRVYQVRERSSWLAQLPERGARFRAEALSAELDVPRELRPTAKAAMLAEARRDPAWRVLLGIPYLGSVRVALLLATAQTPWRFRTKRHLGALENHCDRSPIDTTRRAHRFFALTGRSIVAKPDALT